MLFTAGPEVAQAAIAQVASCEACNPDADWPFEAILDRVMLFSGVHTDYFMPEPPACPRCNATVAEKTLVKWVGVVETLPKAKTEWLKRRLISQTKLHPG